MNNKLVSICISLKLSTRFHRIYFLIKQLTFSLLEKWNPLLLYALPLSQNRQGNHFLTSRCTFALTPLRMYIRSCISLIAHPTSHFRRYIRASGDEWTGTGSESYAMINEWPHGTSASPAHLDKRQLGREWGDAWSCLCTCDGPPWKWLRHPLNESRRQREEKSAPALPYRSTRFNYKFVINSPAILSDDPVSVYPLN